MGSMSAEQVAREVCALVAQVRGLKPDDVAPDATFQSLGVSSLDALSLAFEIEERFKMSVPDDQLAQFRTVRAVIDGVVAMLAKAEP
jgi:acyl carrier protein